ncbi:MAG: transposase, partial [Treponema sp.]|nr:transposase [Treponema sp.]
MRVAMHRRQEIIKTNYKTYQGAGKKKRGAILDRLVPTTGMNQDYLATTRGRYVPNESGTRTSRKKRAEGKRGGRPPVYRSAAFVKALTGIWDFFDYPCGKLLSPLIRGTLGFLEES